MNSSVPSLLNLKIVRASLEHISQGITVFGPDLKLIACNKRFIELLDFPDTLAEPGTDFATFMRHNALRGEYGEGDLEELVEIRVRRARRNEPHEFDRQRPDGSVIRVAGTPLPGGGFVTVYSDVTAQHERQAELEQRVAERTEALKVNEARLRVIANEVKAGIALLDESLGIRYANLRFARAYGYSPSSIEGLPCRQVLGTDTFETALPHFQMALAGQSVDFDGTLKLPDGRVKEIRTFLRPEFSSTGHVSGFYVLSIDMTRQNAADRALFQAQKMEALGRLSAGIAHDFNNLLTVILGNLVPLGEQGLDKDLIKEYLRPAIGAARRGSELTKRLLTLARRQSVQAAPINVHEAINEVLLLVSASIPEGIQIVPPVDRSDPWLRADRNQLEMALLNMTVNALHAIGDKGRIVFSYDQTQLGSDEAAAFKIAPGRYCRIRIADTGRGMTAEEIQHIFDPFYTSMPERGSGLGLAMVYAFIEQSGGAIRVTSMPGSGSSFAILLPACDPPSDPIDNGRAVDEIGVLSRNSLTLLVEDNQEVREVVRRQLVELGYAVVEAGSAEEAATLMDDLPDLQLVVSDIALAGSMSGFDLVRSMSVTFPDLPAVLMTGHGANRQGPGDASAPPILQKPFEKGDLAAAIAKAASAKTRKDAVTE